MNSVLGQGFILLGLAASAFGLVLGLQAGYSQSERGLKRTQWAAYVFAAAMVLANLVMINALLTDDFSVSYVAKVGSKASPTWITIVSLWSSLEGSILFWGAILGVFVGLFTFIHRNGYQEYMAYALAVILGVSAFFAFLIAGPANPFEAISPVPTDGPGPNPLLQNHILMIVHPPTLYIGYVGMTIPFGIAMAAVLRGKLTDGWLKPLRRWTLIPWLSLTIGIILGGWWAYEVLGWGGYWAWDPVENASFLPWLTATAYLHSTVVQERRRTLKIWTMSLVIVTFLLTLLGTFMTRSGVFNSVHSFSQSPIGPTFLVFIAICTIASLGALLGRGHLMANEGRIDSLVSREAMFLVNNVLLVTFTFTVLLGTVYPLLTEAIKGTKLSVGEPYFNQIAIPLGLMLTFLMGVGPALPWGQADKRALINGLVPPAVIGALTALICYVAGVHEGMPLLTFALCAFATAVTLREMFAPVITRMRKRGENLLTALDRSVSGGRRRFGGYIVHLGIIACVAAISASHTYKLSAETSLRTGQSVVVGDYELEFQGMRRSDEPHRMSVSALLNVSKNGSSIGQMRPTLNYYPTQREPVGTPHVRTIGDEDLYVTLLTFENDGNQAAIKIFVNPMVPWIWWSLAPITLGVFISMRPHRKARSVPSTETASARKSA